ncbi:MAG: hypothetical protein ACI4B5_05160 [Bacteroidaceae bacterium]
MNKIFLFLLLMLPIRMNGQVQRFIELGKTWHVKGQVLYPPCELEETYCFTEESDTLVGEVHYMRLFKDNNGSMETSGLFREADGVVYRYYPEHEKEYVFYDFTMESTGTVVTSWLGKTWDFFCEVTEASKQTLLDGSQARRIEMKLTDPYHDETYSEINVWIEGIGSLLHPLLNVGNSMRDGAPIYTVLSVTRGDDVLYRYTPTDISGTSATKDAESPVYDLQGRPVMEDSWHGLIIRNGRKVWVTR